MEPVARAYPVGAVAAAVEAIAPEITAEAWDRVGLQVGDPNQPVTRVLLALDVTQAVVEEAAALGAALILSHHPVIYDSITRLRTDAPQGRMLAALLSRGIAVYAAHTNLDAAPGGTSDHLASRLGLVETVPLLPGPAPGVGLGRLGCFDPPRPLEEVAAAVRDICGTERVLMGGDPRQPIHHLAVCTGSGGSLLPHVLAAGADAYLTGELRYHHALEAREAGLALLEAGHFATEWPGMAALRDLLRPRLPGLDLVLSARPTDPYPEAMPRP